MQTCNVLDKLCIFVDFGMDSQDPCEYAYGNSEIHLFFELIGVLVSIGHGNFGYEFW